MRILHLVASASLLSLAESGECQTADQGDNDGFFGRWAERVPHTQAEQPAWLAPVFTATARLEQMYVFDTSHQQTAKGELSSFGGTKGLLLIPAERINFVITPPSYLVHEKSTLRDGFGDMSLLLKYRLLASSPQDANYVLTAFLGTTLPTGSRANSVGDAIITPTLGFGKGWGDFDIQTTLGAAIPTGNVHKLGTPLAYNAAFQYRLKPTLWPELEVNATSFLKGANVGKTQVFLSPGFAMGKFHLWRSVGFAVGGGIQIAVTHFHTFNHNLVLTVRLPF